MTRSPAPYVAARHAGWWWRAGAAAVILAAHCATPGLLWAEPLLIMFIAGAWALAQSYYRAWVCLAWLEEEQCRSCTG